MSAFTSSDMAPFATAAANQLAPNTNITNPQSGGDANQPIDGTATPNPQMGGKGGSIANAYGPGSSNNVFDQAFSDAGIKGGLSGLFDRVSGIADQVGADAATADALGQAGAGFGGAGGAMANAISRGAPYQLGNGPLTGQQAYGRNPRINYGAPGTITSPVTGLPNYSPKVGGYVYPNQRGGMPTSRPTQNPLIQKPAFQRGRGGRVV